MRIIGIGRNSPAGQTHQLPELPTMTQFMRRLRQAPADRRRSPLIAIALGSARRRSPSRAATCTARSPMRAPIRRSSAPASPSPRRQRVAITDQRGAYMLRDLPAGTYVVMTSAIGRKADSSSVTRDAERQRRRSTSRSRKARCSSRASSSRRRARRSKRARSRRRSTC